MKQQRKNRTNQHVTWPSTSYFTIKELHNNFNPTFVEITLRVRVAAEVKSGKVAEIGWISGGKGRPQKVYALTPISKLTIEKARQNDINLADNYERLINVVSVTTTTSPTPTVSAHAPSAMVTRS